MKVTHMISVILLVIGGLNWGLVGIGNFVGSNWNVVALIFGAVPWLLNIVYILVGVAAICMLFKHKSHCKVCDVPAGAGAPASGSGQQM